MTATLHSAALSAPVTCITSLEDDTPQAQPQQNGFMPTADGPGPATFESLPEEAVRKIVGHLQTPDLGRLAAVSRECRRLSAVLATTLTYTCPYQRRKAGVPGAVADVQEFIKFVTAKVANGMQVQTFGLHCDLSDAEYAVIYKWLRLAVHVCASTLQELSLYTAHLSHRTEQDLLPGLNSLRKLSVHMDSCPRAPLRIIARAKLGALEHLSWLCLEQFSTAGLRMLAAACPRLRVLHLETACFSTGQHCEPLPTSLHSLRLDSCVLDTGMLAGCTSLVNVHLEGNCNSSAHLYPWGQNGVCLEDPVAAFVVAKGQPSVEALMDDLAANSGLEELYLDFGFAHVCTLLTRLPRLESLTLDCSVPDKGMEDVAGMELIGEPEVGTRLRSDSLRRLVFAGTFSVCDACDLDCAQLRVLSFESSLKRFEYVLSQVGGLKAQSPHLETLVASRNLLAITQGEDGVYDPETGHWKRYSLGNDFFCHAACLSELRLLGFNTCLSDLTAFSTHSFGALRDLHVSPHVFNEDDDAVHPDEAEPVAAAVMATRICAACPLLRCIVIHMSDNSLSPDGLKRLLSFTGALKGVALTVMGSPFNLQYFTHNDGSSVS